ncbi:hypothetical protein RXV95_15610 [Novosphingobium sp. ZN18A2]|uniref:hypothetical protein n=1 Tax=Novosphingobium sp. ZN18A2 TaxID=3079861 RepID=UPI0030CF671A
MLFGSAIEGGQIPETAPAVPGDLPVIMPSLADCAHFFASSRFAGGSQSQDAAR